MFENLRYFFDFINKEIYGKYNTDQVGFINGNLLFYNNYLFVKTKINIHTGVSYSIDIHNFKKFYKLLPYLKTIEFNSKSIILNNHEIIIPNNIDDSFYYFDSDINLYNSRKRFKYDFSWYNDILKIYDCKHGIKSLKHIILKNDEILLLNNSNDGISASKQISDKLPKFSLAFKSLNLSRFLNLARHYNIDVSIDIDDGVLFFSNGIQKGFIQGTEV